MAQRPPTPPPGGPNYGGLSKNLALLALVVLIGLALFQVMGGQDRASRDFVFTEFEKQLDAGIPLTLLATALTIMMASAWPAHR